MEITIAFAIAKWLGGSAVHGQHFSLYVQSLEVACSCLEMDGLCICHWPYVLEEQLGVALMYYRLELMAQCAALLAACSPCHGGFGGGMPPGSLDNYRPCRGAAP